MASVSALRLAWIIAVKDATETWRDGRFRWASGIVVLMLVVALASGWIRTQATTAAHAEAQRVEREMSLDKGAMNPHAAAHYGAFVFKPVAPLSAIDPGLDPFLGVSVFLEAHQQELSRHQIADDSSPLRRFSDLTPATVLQLLTPLLIVLSTGGAFAAEREAGTLRQLMSVKVPRRSLIVGKALGALLPLTAIFGPIAVLAIGLLTLGAPAGMRIDTLLRVALLAGVYTAYFALWAGIGLLVSSRMRSTMASLAVLLTIWFVWVLVLPPLALGLARGASATASGAFARAIDEGRAALPRWDRRVDGVEERFLSGDLELEPGMPSNPEVIALVEAEADETALFDQRLGELYGRYERQAGRYALIGAVAPTIAVQAVSMALAGTDYAHHRRFLEATARYRREFLETLNAELTAYDQLDTFDYTRGREFWASIPVFAYEGPRAGEVMPDQASGVVTILGWSAVVGALLLRSLSTIPVD